MPRHRLDVVAGVQLLDPAVLSRVGFTDHAIERFAQRAGLAVSHRAVVEPIIRDLLAQEGLVAHRLPRWAHSRRRGDLHLQIGQWMLLICRHDPHRAGRYDAVTVVNGPAENTWTRALQHGYLATPPPIILAHPARRQRAHWTTSIHIGLRQHRRDSSPTHGLIATILSVHRERLATFAVRDVAADSKYRRATEEHQQRRRMAYQQHLRRYGQQPSRPHQG